MALYNAGKNGASGRERTGDEVFTPQRVVNDMLDMLQKENPDAFQPGFTYLEPSCGEGAFLVEILRRKFQNCRTRQDFRISLASVYGMDIQADNIDQSIQNVTALCKEYFKPNKDDLQTIRDHCIQCDSLKVMNLLSSDARLNVIVLMSSDTKLNIIVPTEEASNP